MWVAGYDSLWGTLCEGPGQYPERGVSDMEIICASIFLVAATGYIIAVSRQAKK
jgi:hypothetical protein